MAADLLYEIGVEEIPANAVLPALAQLEAAIGEGLDRLRLDHGPIATYGTPRRLAIVVNDVDDRQEDVVEEIKGPPAQAAFDAQGNPTQAAVGFASSRGVELSALEVRTVDEGEWVFARVSRPGQPATEVLPQLLKQATEQLSFPKTMWWAEVGFRFARPVRWLVALLGDELLDLEIAGVSAGKSTRGHRVLGSSSAEIEQADEYLELLEANSVIADHGRRREMIVQQVTELAAAQGCRARIDPDILTEVNFLVEYPSCVLGSFDSEYLQLPEEVIVTVLQGHQKAFAVEDEQGNLAPNFIAVTNAAPGAADTVCSGWEKVIVPRLDDAQFYYEQDMGQALAERREALKRVTFMGKLGTLYDQSERLAELTSWLADHLDEVSEPEAQTACRAAELAKCDQVTMMVRDGKLGEVLQGVIGGYYARDSGESPGVATAISEQYLPVQPGDAIPATLAGRMLSLADKMDHLAACLRLGEIPRGSADPYALRRRAGGVIEIVRQTGYHFPLSGFIQQSLASLPVPSDESSIVPASQAASRLQDLFAERLQAAWEQQGIDYDICRAVLATDWDDIAEANVRANMLSELRSSAPGAFADLVTAGERPARIARPQDIPEAAEVETALFEHPMETQLLEEFAGVRDEVETLLEDKSPDWAQVGVLLAGLLPVIHQYFEDVMVMVEDEALCRNRLTLLRDIDELFLHLADFVEIVQSSE